jgi:protein O-mannosyl-transferase
MERRKNAKPSPEAGVSQARVADADGAVRRGNGRLAVWGIAAGLALAVCLVFGQTLAYDFVNFDDHEYVLENSHVRDGFTTDWIAWAFASAELSNWHPVTWFSLTLDTQIFGPAAWGYHLTNVLLHAANAVIFFLLLRRMTGNQWASAAAAAVFAVHPLRAESVAWITERKDVLSGLFFLLTLHAYARYVDRRDSLGRYLLVALWLTLGLMSKAMLVTTPCVLGLLDYWPLRRPVPLRRLVGEKIPLLALSAAACLWTVSIQDKTLGGADVYPVSWRIGNITISYVTYIGSSIFPANLAAAYPRLPVPLPWGQAAVAAAILAGLTAFALARRRNCPYLLVGWFWYLGMLAPVIGVLQVGTVSVADRFTYLPQMGLAIAAVWGIAELSRSWPRRGLVCGAAATVAILLLMIVAARQTSYWRNSETLWKHALACTSRNVSAYCNYGSALVERGEIGEAIRQYREALQIDPRWARAHDILGEALQRLGMLDAAIREGQESVRLDPASANAQYNLGESLRLRGRLDEAVGRFRTSLRLRSQRADAHTNLGAALGQQGKTDEAIDEFREALKLDRRCAEAHDNLGFALLSRGHAAEAIEHCRCAVQLKPTYARAYKHLAEALARGGQRAEAVATARRALDLAVRQGDTPLAEAIKAQIATYEE